MAAPFRVTDLDHVVLRCVDQARTLAFYIDVLGCHEERRLEVLGLIQLRAGRSLIDLIPADRPASRDAPNVEHVCLATDAATIEPILAQLAHHGVELIGEPMLRYGATGYGTSVYCRDPEGNVIELKCVSMPGAS